LHPLALWHRASREPTTTISLFAPAACTYGATTATVPYHHQITIHTPVRTAWLDDASHRRFRLTATSAGRHHQVARGTPGRTASVCQQAPCKRLSTTASIWPHISSTPGVPRTTNSLRSCVAETHHSTPAFSSCPHPHRQQAPTAANLSRQTIFLGRRPATTPCAIGKSGRLRLRLPHPGWQFLLPFGDDSNIFFKQSSITACPRPSLLLTTVTSLLSWACNCHQLVKTSTPPPRR